MNSILMYCLVTGLITSIFFFFIGRVSGISKVKKSLFDYLKQDCRTGYYDAKLKYDYREYKVTCEIEVVGKTLDGKKVKVNYTNVIPHDPDERKYNFFTEKIVANLDQWVAIDRITWFSDYTDRKVKIKNFLELTETSK